MEGFYAGESIPVNKKLSEFFLQLHLVEVIKLGKTTIDKGISELKKKGYIERVGSNKNGYWNVLKY